MNKGNQNTRKLYKTVIVYSHTDHIPVNHLTGFRTVQNFDKKHG